MTLTLLEQAVQRAWIRGLIARRIARETRIDIRSVFRIVQRLGLPKRVPGRPRSK